MKILATTVVVFAALFAVHASAGTESDHTGQSVMKPTVAAYTPSGNEKFGQTLSIPQNRIASNASDPARNANSGK